MLSLYNTLTKQKEVFAPLDAGEVKMYTCGPTVYDYVHIGNLRSYVMADTLRRVLEASGLTVKHVKNITDVGHLTADDIAQGDSGEDKIAKKAAAEHKTPEEIATFYTDYYRQAEAALNILPPHEQPKATSYIAEMISFIERLIEHDYAYAANGNVFFAVKKFADYGKLSGNTLDALKVGARLEEHPDKRDPWDFALWLKAPTGHLMHWDSPWRVGYPGWHIECSAMNLATLGKTIDIHTGGEDNIFPHHEAEIAQSECGNGVKFTRYWVHARHLLVNGQKMSKSKGNFYRLEDVLERGFTAMDLRMLFLSAHYRSQMNFTWDALAQAKANRQTFENTLSRLHRYIESNEQTSWGNQPIDLEKLRAEFFEALYDDLNTQKALASLYWLCTTINSFIDKEGLPHPQIFLDFIKNSLEEVFGLIFEVDATVPELVTQLVDKRKGARENKDFTQSDLLRDEIAKLGYIVEDSPNGQTVRKK
ncbi:MAG: cysteine--tRNA ligase [Undibacterium sp.]